MYEILCILRLNLRCKKTKEILINLEITLGNWQLQFYLTEVTVLKE